jgi:hypothetical protein
MVLSASCVCVIGVSCLITSYCYYYVYQVFKHCTAKASQNITQKYNVTQKQMVVFRKCLIVTVVFISCWSPELLRILYELVSGREVLVEIACVASLMAMSNSAVNPWLLYFLDNRIRGNVREFFGLERIVQKDVGQISTLSARPLESILSK